MPETTLEYARDEKTEEGLSIAIGIISNQVYKRANLPKLLADVAIAGFKEEALEGLIAWGTGTKPVEDLWEEFLTMIQKKSSVVGGVKLCGNKDVTG